MQNIASRNLNWLLNKYNPGQVLHYYLDSWLSRFLNIIVAIGGLILLSPLFLLIGFLIKRDSSGPVFYRGLRTGKDNKPFDILKFRTMYERPESYSGPKITGQGDKRITPIGQWLRDTKLNELPQLWNVLLGEMNIVGPRPEDPDYVALWPEETRRLLLSVRPGITSPASIIYRDEEQMLQASDIDNVYLNEILPSKLRLDSSYVSRRSILSDLDVIFWTLIMLMPRLKEKQIPDHLLFWGPLSRLISRYFSWFFIDTLIAFVAVVFAGLLWRSVTPLHIGLATAVPLAIVVALGFSIVNTAFGLTRIVWSRASGGYIMALFGSTVMATIVLLLVNSQLPLPMPYGLLILSGVFAWLGFVLIRYRSRLLIGGARHWLNLRPNATAIGERVLIIGAGSIGGFAASMLNKGILNPTFTVVGMVDDDPRMVGAQINECRVLGTTSDLVDLVPQLYIDVLVFAIAQLSHDDRERILQLCHNTSARVIFLPEVVSSIKAKFLNGQSKIAEVFPTEQLQMLLVEVDRLLLEKRVQQARTMIQTFQSEMVIELPEKINHHQNQGNP